MRECERVPLGLCEATGCLKAPPLFLPVWFQFITPGQRRVQQTWASPFKTQLYPSVAEEPPLKSLRLSEPQLLPV